jgi:hypothetical protein
MDRSYTGKTPHRFLGAISMSATRYLLAAMVLRISHQRNPGKCTVQWQRWWMPYRQHRFSDSECAGQARYERDHDHTDVTNS